MVEMSEKVSFSFVDFYLLYEVESQVAPAGIEDGINIDGNNVINVLDVISLINIILQID